MGMSLCKRLACTCLQFALNRLISFIKSQLYMSYLQPYPWPAAAAAAAFVCTSAGVQECAYKPKQGGAADDNDSEMQVESSVRSLTGGAKSGRRRSVLSSLLAPDSGIIPGLDVYREAVSTATTLCRGCCVMGAYSTTTTQAQHAALGSHKHMTRVVADLVPLSPLSACGAATSVSV